MTGDKAVEQAITTLLEAAVRGNKHEPTVHPWIARTEDDHEIKYPMIMLATDPFQPETPGSVLGNVIVRLGVRTQQNDDPNRAILEELFELTTGVMTEAQIGPLVMSPWLVCGIDDTLAGGISVDPENKTQDKVKPYRIPLFLSTTTTTTT